MKIQFIAASVSAAVLGFAASSQAATWVFDYAAFAGSPFAAAGTLTTADTLNGAGGFDITGITGNVDGDAIVGLVANVNQPFASISPDGLWSFDNVLFPGAQSLSTGGLVFTTAGGSEFNLYGNSPVDYTLYRSFGGGYQDHSDGLFSVAGVPEPAAWALMLTGFALIGATLRRRHGLALAAA